MQKIRTAATHIGLGIGAVYALFLIPDISGQFETAFISTLRQGLIIGFAICLLINPQSLISAGEAFAPKVIKVLQLLFNSKKDENSA